MSWDMIMKLPIQDRRALIQKHNKEQDEMERMYNDNGDSNTRIHEGESLNVFAQMEQSNLKGGR